MLTSAHAAYSVPVQATTHHALPCQQPQEAVPDAACTACHADTCAAQCANCAGVIDILFAHTVVMHIAHTQARPWLGSPASCSWFVTPELRPPIAAL